MQIKNRWNGKVIFVDDAKTIKETVRNAVESGSDLRGSDLRGSDLRGSDLSDSDLSDSDLRGSNLSDSDLSDSDLRGSDLSDSDLSDSDLRGSNLRGSKIEFYNLPSLRTLSSISFNNLPDNLQLELMRRDAQAHPHPELFDEWIKTKEWPYQNEERFWLFEPKPQLWKPGKPEMSDFDLIIALVQSQGWKIRNYLK